MKRKAFLLTFSRSAVASALVAVMTLPFTGCLYGFRGGGGFPSDVRSIFIAPLENRTNQFDIDQEIARQLTNRVPSSLGVRLAGENAADAILRARITGYQDAAQNYTSSQPGTVEVLQHQVQITMAVEVVDVKRNEILWESQGLTGRGEYRPSTQTDQAARVQAIESLIQQIIDGAQSQW
jgi:hypothetical protein